MNMLASLAGLVRREFVFLGILLLVVSGPIVGAFLLEKRHRRLRPDCKPFAWGYYNGLGALMMSVAVGASHLSEGWKEAALMFGAFGAVFIPLGILTIRRDRGGFLLLTILQLNPIMWAINGVYLSNRWQELASPKRPVPPSPMPKRPPVSRPSPVTQPPPPSPPPPAPAVFKFACPHCGQRISTTADCIGTVGGCPACGNSLVVPEPEA